MKQVNKKRKKAKGRIRVLLTIVKFALLLLVIVGIPIYIVLFHADFISQFKTLDSVNAYLEQYKTASIFVYIALQIVQIIICIIPGQGLQFTAGYAYGFWLGFLFSLIGAAVGAIITFYLARFLGRDALHLIFGEERINKFVKRINSKRGFTIVFVIFLVPGLPKDLLNYAAGVSNMRLKAFLLISLIGRSPAMMCSIMIGSMFNKGSYVGIGILAFIAAVLCVLGIKFHENLTKYIDQCYNKLIRM
ncbi:TVP38/TMEM64 family protein [Clostridium aminobutyricum]|uniref:TVP38/TMEM64 family membrane protein n=1 Tax=Clostridium aminobutyricum TaxID=33953 RepID=A0A939IGU1_CLOAM|nr:VTT domain-containing protein [Clostridium aminobutyricum]MBN7772512.1 VTT domain-containing protein [Clostridium aminobutyricum]